MIRSVTRNVRSIIFTFILAVILVYFFSIVGFMFSQGNKQFNLKMYLITFHLFR